MRKKFFIIFLFLITALSVTACDKTDSECNHEKMSDMSVEPTCTSGGYTVRTCDDCGDFYVSEYSDALGHSYSKRTVEPTCTKAGYTEYECSCGDTYISDYTDALGHSYISKITPPECEKHGYTTYTCELCSDSYVSDYTCEKGHILIATQTEQTCTLQGYTTYSCDCGYSFVSDYIKPSGHIYTEEIISVANCTDKGETVYTCSCGDSYTLTDAPLGHSFNPTVTMPTLSDMGYTKYQCSNCTFEYVGDYMFYSSILKDAYATDTVVKAKGIDVSYHNYQIDTNGEYVSLDWEAIKSSGVTYVIIRVGDAAIGLDPTFEKTYSEAKAAGLDVGVYFYTRAKSVNETMLEANFVLSALQNKQLEYPVYLDLEDESLRTLDPAILNEMCVKFFTTLQRSGFYTGLYVNDEWLYNVIDTDSALSRFDIWYARYPSLEEGSIYEWDTESFGKTLGMWQYTDSGMIDGIEHTVFDFNYCYKDYPSIIKQYGFNGYESNFTFPDTEKTFVWIIYPNPINVRSKSDYFTSNDYDPSLDIIGYAQYGTRFEVFEITESYTAIIYNGEIAYISAKPEYVSFTGLHS